MLAYGTYPLVNNAYASFIKASSLHDVEISGSGTIDGQGEYGLYTSDQWNGF